MSHQKTSLTGSFLFDIMSLLINLITYNMYNSINGGSDNTFQTNTSKNILIKISFVILLIVIFVTPLAFSSISFAPLDIIKSSIITFGVLISAILYFLYSFKYKTLSLPKNSLTIISILILLSTVISTAYSGNILKSIFGQGFEIGSMSFLLSLFLCSFLVYHLTKNRIDRTSHILKAILISFIIIALFHIIRFFAGAEFMNFGIFNLPTSTSLGKWGDLAVFSGIIAVLSYIRLRFSDSNRKNKYISWSLFILSAIIIFVVNSAIVWFITALTMLGISAYEFSNKLVNQTGFRAFLSKIPRLSVIIMLVAVLCAWNSSVISKYLANTLKISNSEISLPWQLTMDIASETIKESPLVGAGPNRFGVQYLKYKPQEVNPTQFWVLEFSNGFGFLPSFIVTQGIIGFILLILLLILFLKIGYKILLQNSNTSISSNLPVINSFFVSLFLVLVSLLYVPSHSILLLTAVFIGLFISSISKAEYSIKNTKVVSILSILLVFLCVFWLAMYTKKIISLKYFEQGLKSINIPKNEQIDKAELSFKIDKAELSFKKAISYDESDIYYQALSEINIIKINALTRGVQDQIQKGAKSADPEIIKQIGVLVEEAVSYTRKATSIDSTNYYNYLSEARISEIATSLQIPNAYDNAKNAYVNALRFNPYNPSIYLSVARLEASQGKMVDAQKFIGSALQLKQNYLEAIFLLSQIQVSQGQIKDAITSVQVAIQINPNDPSLFFQLGLLYYNDKNYQGAIDALNQAVKINGEYANARYFLGLSYARTNKTADAIVQFENLSKTNPDNQEVSLILSNLQSGKAIFADAIPPIDSKPEKRKSLPIQEKRGGKTSGI